MPAYAASRMSVAGCPVVALLGLLLLALAAAVAPCAAAVEIIVSPDRSAAPPDRDTLRAMFTTRLREWPDGEPVRVFVMPDDSPVHDQFCREQLGIYPYVLRQLWDRLQFTGTGLPPTTVRSEAEMRQRVKSTPGAIGYVAGVDIRPGAASAPSAAARPLRTPQ